jgi:sulfopyruvate decarboxylase TPP-binding subunit
LVPGSRRVVVKREEESVGVCARAVAGFGEVLEAGED